MGQAATQSLYGALDDSQKNKLIAIKRHIESSGMEKLESKPGDQVIEILESWLLDDEQKQSLQSNVWDIYFLFAAAELLSLMDMDGTGSFAGGESSKNPTKISPDFEPTNATWPALDIADGQQAEIFGLIGKGYLASNAMHPGNRRN